MMRKRFMEFLGYAATLVAVALIYMVLRRTDVQGIWDAAKNVAPSALILPFVFTVVSFIFIAVQEYLAILYNGASVSIGRVAATSLAAVGVGHSVGFAVLSGGIIRARMYGRAGLDLVAVGEIIVFNGVSLGLGFAAVAGFLLLYRGDSVAPLAHIPDVWMMPLGVLSLVLIAGYLVACALWRGTFNFRKLRFRLPSLPLAVGQIVASVANIVAMAALLMFAIRPFLPVDLADALLMRVAADVAAAVIHVPGGWGVQEFIAVETMGTEKVLSGMLLFRGIYYLLPLVVGAAVFIIDDFHHIAGRLRPSSHKRAGRHA